MKGRTTFAMYVAVWSAMKVPDGVGGYRIIPVRRLIPWKGKPPTGFPTKRACLAEIASET